ncbi:hypothetical protein [Methylosinus sp. Sm6]|uniref:hypothetical protein n=1 Tax=Methylosinus sp. Sm6 TaxID=2866948 RepID=UPI001C99AB27|nr:hypothetical protein [Methylosinus sp. Sm6]MBY6242249.1 hypothetical protein [Methylosinus sp. Sm6]
MVQGEREQSDKRRGGRLSARPAVASLVALFVILQGLASVGSSFVRHRHGNEPATAFFSPVALCATGSPHEKAPSQQPIQSQCCVICGARDYDGASAVVLTPDSPTTAPLAASGSIAKNFVGAPPPPVSGWASSWSSRAPPSFS